MCNLVGSLMPSDVARTLGLMRRGCQLQHDNRRGTAIRN